MSSNIHIFTTNTLDGVGCLQLLNWAFEGVNVDFTVVSAQENFIKKFNKVSEKNVKYDIIFIINIPVSEEALLTVDKKNIIIIDNRVSSTHDKLKAAQNFSKESFTCLSLVYKLFKTKLKLQDSQKKFIAIIEDYYTNNTLSVSRDINILLQAHYINNVPLFLSDFENGYTGFSKLQKTIIQHQTQKCINTLNSLPLYQASINIQNKLYKAIAAFTNFSLDYLLDILIQQNNCNIAIIVNIDTEQVFLKSDNNFKSLSSFAKKICDGDGHKNIAEGKITETFLTFTKLFTHKATC